MGRLDCLDAQTGEVIWYKQLAALFDAPVPTWGWSAHPVVWENMVFVLAGGKGSAVAAFDKDSGEELWSALTVEEIGYAPPLLIEAGGKRQLVVWLDTSVSGLDPQTGAVLWSEKSPEPGPPQRPVVNIAAPIAGQGRLFVSEFYQGALMLELASDRPGPAVMWRSTESNPMQPEHLNCIMSTPLLKDGHLYGMCGFGELRCLKADTGEVVWESLEAIGGRKAQSATAFLVPHEDRCFLFSDQGDLIIARLSPEGYEELDRAHLLDPTTFARGRTVVWSHPAFAGRCVFARNDKEMICVSLASEG
jgi:outer membrane protein assembly factor BamB